MKENLKKFTVEISTNKDLYEAIKKLNAEYPDKDENVERLIVLAKEYGFELVKEDFEETAELDSNIDDGEMDTISGGNYPSSLYMTDCFCILGGGGSADEYQKACACVAAGAGELTEYGKELAAQKILGYAGDSSAPVAMACAIGGMGWPGGRGILS